MTRILIVDDHREIRESVRNFLQLQEGWEVCGESANGEEAVLHAETLQPHVIILDVLMPIMDGFTAARKILLKSQGMLILIVSVHETAFLRNEARACGAKGFLPKHQFGEHLVPVIEALLRGEEHFPNGTIKQAAPH